MATPPTRVSYNAPSTGNFSSTATSRTTTSFDVTAGDIIIVLASLENGGSQTAVTPSASGGSVTWTQQARVPAASNASTSAAWCWTGVVGATATGITVTLNRPSSDTTLWWGMSATVYTAHGGVGVAFSGTNGTGADSAPSASATCSANSAVVCQVNDWQARSTARTWRTINGAAETETVYFTNATHHTVYGGYRADTGAAGSITQGLTAPSNQRWVLAGVEILGVSGATNYNGTSTAASTASVTGAGEVGKVATSTAAATASVAAGGAVGKVATAAVAATVAIAAAGVVGLSATATITETGSTTSTGSVVSGSSATSTISATGSTSAAGQLGTTTDAAVASAGAIAATGLVARASSSSIASTGTISAAGSVVAGGSAAATIGTTATVNAVGVVARSAGATIAATGSTTAAGSTGAGPNAGTSIAAAGVVTAAGQVARLSLASVGATAQLFADGHLGVSRAASVSATATIAASGVAAEPAGRTPPERRGSVAGEARTSARPVEARTANVPAESRSGTIPAESRIATGEAMHSFVKDPADKLDYERGWADWLAQGETISSVTWSVPAGITQSSVPASSNTTTTATIWLEGGTDGEDYVIGCRIATNQSRTAERSFTILVRNQ